MLKIDEIKNLDLFSGYGGFTIACEKNGIETIGFSEIDKYANAVLKFHYPKIKNYGDITKIKTRELPDFDLLTGGSPCQDLSIAGKRGGIHASRSGLFFQFIRILCTKKPAYFIWENVKGVLSSNRGFDFARILLEMEQAGYSLWWQVLNAKDFGVPQNRERIFVVGFREKSPPEVFFERENYKKDIIHPTIDANYYKGQSNQRKSIQIIDGYNHKYLYSKEIGTIRQNMTNGGSLLEITKNKSQGYRVYNPQGIATNIASQAGGLGAKTGLYAIPILTPDRIKKKQNGRRFKTNGEPSFTLTGQDIHGVIIPNKSQYDTEDSKPEIGQAKRIYGMKKIIPPLNRWSPCIRVQAHNSADVHFIPQNSRIRRLTPKECERLMGIEDDWTKFGINEKGEKIEISDSQRYKMCGNGIVVNVVDFLIKNLLNNKI